MNKWKTINTYPATTMKKSNRFQVSDRYELGAFIMPMASILMTISRAKKPNIMSSNVCNILHRDVVQVSSSAHGWYMPNVTQFNSIAIILMRSNHVLFVEKGKFIFQQKKEKKKKKERKGTQGLSWGKKCHRFEFGNLRITASNSISIKNIVPFNFNHSSFMTVTMAKENWKNS